MSTNKQVLEFLDKELDLSKCIFTGGVADYFHRTGNIDLIGRRDIDIIYTDSSIPSNAEKFLTKGDSNLMGIMLRNFDEPIYFGRLPETDIRIDIYVGGEKYKKFSTPTKNKKVNVVTFEYRIDTLQRAVDSMKWYTDRWMSKIKELKSEL